MSHSAFVTRPGTRQRKLGVAVLLAALMSPVLLIGSAGAQQTAVQSYDVELLIFRNLAGRETPENWGAEAAAAAQRLSIPDEEQAGTVEAPAAVMPTTTFPALPAAKMKLTAIEDTMRRSRAYQPLAHIGWTQPGFARNSAKYLSLSSLVPGGSGLQGQVALSRGRYLHLTLDLLLDSSSDGQRYVLRQTRRMRSNERHYIDSPKIGVIAVITPSAGGEAN